jgi:hypothetical protein
MTKHIGKRVGDATKTELKGLALSEWDLKNISYLVNLFDKAYPGYIQHFTSQSFAEVEPLLKQTTFKKSELNMSRRMSIPRELWNEIKRGYPAILSEPQFSQFLKRFPMFDLHNR